MAGGGPRSGSGIDGSGRNSLNIVGFNLSRTAGPALGGVVVAAAGPQGAFLANALSYLGLLLVLAFWLRQPTDRATHPSAPMLAAIREGLSYGFGTPGLRRILLRVTLYGLALGALLALIPLVVRRLDAGPGGMGLIFGCSGAGAVAGAIAANPLRVRFGAEPVLRGSVLATAGAIFAVSMSRKLFLTAGAEVVTGFASAVVYTILNLLVQIKAPKPMLGRLLSIHQMGAFGGLAAGTWLWGWFAEKTDVATALLGAAGLMMTLTFMGWWIPMIEGPET